MRFILPALSGLCVLAILATREAHAQTPPAGTDTPSANGTSSDGPDATPEPAGTAHRPYNPGIRRVATPTARQRRRAERLGLGTYQAARTLLFGSPQANWVVAAGGRRPRNFLWPVREGVKTQGFQAMGGTHRALDLGADCGATIRAAHAGIVGYSDNAVYGLGNAVVLVGAGGYVTAYGHARRTLVAAGAMVQRGEPIAEVGDTGRAQGCHVHFMVLHNGTRVDPEPMMTGRPGGDPAPARMPHEPASSRPNHEVANARPTHGATGTPSTTRTGQHVHGASDVPPPRAGARGTVMIVSH